MAVKAVIHVPTGEFRNKQGLFEFGPFEPRRPVLSTSAEGLDTFDPDYDVVVVPEGTSPRLHKWSGGARVNKTAPEIAAYDGAQPKFIRTRDLLRRITSAEQDKIDELAQANKPLRRLMHLMLSDGQTDVNHPDFIQGWNYIKSIGVPTIWPDNATADAAIARIRA